VAEEARLQQDLPAVMAVVDHVIREESGGVVAKPVDASVAVEGSSHDAQHRASLRPECAGRLSRGHAKPVKLGRRALAARGAPHVDEPAVVQVRDERGNAASRSGQLGPPHGGIQVFHEVLIHARARRVRPEERVRDDERPASPGGGHNLLPQKDLRKGLGPCRWARRRGRATT
jgi:hypothetical protein